MHGIEFCCLNRKNPIRSNDNLGLKKNVEIRIICLRIKPRKNNVFNLKFEFFLDFFVSS